MPFLRKRKLQSIPKIIKKEQNVERIVAYLTPSLKQKYNEIIIKRNLTWSGAVKQGLQLLLEENNLGKMYGMMFEIMAVLKGASHIPKVAKKGIGIEWIDARKRVKERELIRSGAQTSEHNLFMKEIIPDLGKKLKMKNKGLELVSDYTLSLPRPKTNPNDYYKFKQQRVKMEE